MPAVPGNQSARRRSTESASSAPRRKTAAEGAGFSLEFGSIRPLWTPSRVLGHQAATSLNTPRGRSK
jgi:hypothetical protein